LGQAQTHYLLVLLVMLLLLVLLLLFRDVHCCTGSEGCSTPHFITGVW